MKIYVNEFQQIKAVGVNDTGIDTLEEIEVPDDFLSEYCNTVIKAFCYERMEGGGISVYPYKDYSMLECIQDMDNLRERLRTATLDMFVSDDFRITAMELGADAAEATHASAMSVMRSPFEVWTTYFMCEDQIQRMIKGNKCTVEYQADMQTKLDVFLRGNRIDQVEYDELVDLLYSSVIGD